jgi:HlyD family secretion protein
MSMDRRIERKWYQARWLRWTVGFGSATVLLTTLIVSEQSRSQRGVRADYLTIATVRKGPFSEYVALNGTVQPIRTVYLDAVAGGRVEEVTREAGTLVEAGDTILRLSNSALVLDVMNREAQLFEQRNNLRNSRLAMQRYSLDLEDRLLELDRSIQVAQRTYERNRELRDHQLVSLDELTDSKQEFEHLRERRDLLLRMQAQDATFRGRQVAMLEESVERLQTNLEFVQRNLEELWLRAPVSGLLTSLNAEVGESKSQGERLGQIDVLDGFKVRAEVDEYYITRTAIGLTGTFELAGRTYRLRVTRVYPEVTDGRFVADLEFLDEAPDDIRRGQTLRIQLQLGDPIESVLLPQGGFYSTTGGHWIFVVNEEKTAAVRREIRIGRKNPQMFEVLDGLAPGERVVVSAYDDLGDVNRLILRD